MLVFILKREQRLPKIRKQLILNYYAPSWEFVYIVSPFGKQMNRRLLFYGSSFFITIYEGDHIRSAFYDEVINHIKSLSAQQGGIIFRFQDKILPHPTIWRTSAVKKEGGFSDELMLPFEKYIFIDKYEQISPKWHWKVIDTKTYIPQENKSPRWEKGDIEQRLIVPLLCRPRRSYLFDPLVSVVICCYNHSHYLPWAIRSVLNQKGCWELLIIDDGSTDQTKDIVKPFLLHPNITYYRNIKNGGKSACLNQALTYTKGKWLLELDADDWLAPDCIQTLLDFVQEMNTGVVYADHFQWIERVNKQCIFQSISKGINKLDKEVLLMRSEPLAPRMFNISCIEQLGGWLLDDPYQGRLYEDFQMLIRICDHYSYQYLPLPLYHRRISTRSITHQSEKKFPQWKKWMTQLMNNR